MPKVQLQQMVDEFRDTLSEQQRKEFNFILARIRKETERTLLSATDTVHSIYEMLDQISED